MKSIYVVDDAADYRFLVQQVCQRFLPQFSLILLPDGRALIEHVSRLSQEELLPGLIVLDMDMKMSGIETLSWLKQQRAWQSIPVVMTSNRTDMDFSVASYQRGASQYIAKPVNIKHLQRIFTQLGEKWLTDKVD